MTAILVLLAIVVLARVLLALIAPNNALDRFLDKLR